MKSNSINNSNGCSVCEQRKENYTTFRPAHRPKQTFFQYDYRDINNELFSTVAPTLEECRKRRDEWLNNKAVLQTLNDWWKWLSFDEYEDITGIEQGRDTNNEEDVRFIDNANLFWKSKTLEEKIEIFNANSVLYPLIEERIRKLTKNWNRRKKIIKNICYVTGRSQKAQREQR
jgi:hypothetical protein